MPTKLIFLAIFFTIMVFISGWGAGYVTAESASATLIQQALDIFEKLPPECRGEAPPVEHMQND